MPKVLATTTVCAHVHVQKLLDLLVQEEIKAIPAHLDHLAKSSL
jgi:hypothetical protein